MNTDHKLSHRILTHQNSVITHHFFHHLMKAVQVFILLSSMLYSRACLHIGQNIHIPSINIKTTAKINQNILNLCIAFTKYSNASEISTHELY